MLYQNSLGYFPVLSFCFVFDHEFDGFTKIIIRRAASAFIFREVMVEVGWFHVDGLSDLLVPTPFRMRS